MVKGHRYSHIRAVTFLPIHMVKHQEAMTSLGKHPNIIFFIYSFFKFLFDTKDLRKIEKIIFIIPV